MALSYNKMYQSTLVAISPVNFSPRKLLNGLLRRSCMCRPVPTKYLLAARGSSANPESPTKASAMYAVYMVNIRCPREVRPFD